MPGKDGTRMDNITTLANGVGEAAGSGLDLGLGK
jgi:hypothetical protein